ncbi:MAG: hypothetical protein ACI9DH_000556 [Halioglobus sp.]|jgi:hypothetical protein
MKTRSKYLLAKIESTYKTDPTPVASEAILTHELERTIYDGNVIERGQDRATFGSTESINTAPFVTHSYGVEVAGSGTLGTAPAFGVLLRACGMAQTVSAGVSVEYDPVSSSLESIAAYYDRGGERQISLGMRGNCALSFAVGAIPMMNFTFTGLYAKPATVTAVTPVTTTFQVPVPVNKTNTPTCTIGTYDLIVQSLDIDFGNDVSHLNLVNFEEVLQADRAMSGSMTVIAPTIATKDMFALVESHAGASSSAFQLIHGASPNLFQVDAPAMQLNGISEVDINGEQGYTIQFKLLPSSGDDDIKITIA